MKKIVLLLLVFFAVNVYSQERPKTKFGKISKEELQRTVCESDSTSVAEVLFDVGNSYFLTPGREGFKINFEKHFRIKIYKKEGYKYADFMMPLYVGSSGRENVTQIKCVTYSLENGKIVKTKLKRSEVYYDKVHKRRVDMRFAFPAVKEGVIIEGKITIISDFYLNIRDWTFQKTIPVRYSEYVTTAPEYFIYRYNIRNFDFVSVAKKEENMRENFTLYFEGLQGEGGVKQRGIINLESNSLFTEWRAFNIPAFKDEEYMTSKRNYIAGVDYTLSYIRYSDGSTVDFNSSWAAIDNGLIKSFTFGLLSL